MIVSEEIIMGLLGRFKSRLGLHDWIITVQWVTKKNDEDGKCKPTYGQDHAIIEIDSCIGNDFKRFRHVLLHELMHIRLWRATSAVERLEDSGVMGGPAWAVFYAMFREQLERDTEALTETIQGAPGEWADEDLRLKHEENQKPTEKGGST